MAGVDVMRLVIVVEFDSNALDWQGKLPTDIVAAYNDYYSRYPCDAFEIALKDDRFKVVEAKIQE
jgi:hypothetical protein